MLRLLLPLVTCLLLMVLPVSSYNQQCTRAFTKEGLLSSLRKKEVRKGDLKFVAGQMQKCGVNFELKTPADEEEIRREGKYLGNKGLDDLVAAIKGNYRPDVAQQPTSAEIKADEPKPNLIPVGYGKRHILYDPATRTLTEGDTGIPAVVAKFRNAHERGKAISEAQDIRAHIGYEPLEYYKRNLDKNITGFASVNDGIWLNEKNALVNFTRGETKTLILAVQMPDGGFGGFDAFEHRIKTINGNELFLPKFPILMADVYVVKVVLTGGANGDVSELYHFTLTLRPEFKISYG